MKYLAIGALLALSACNADTAVGNASSVAVVTGQVELKATTGLSLGELAYNSAEAAATAALRSGHLSAADAQNLGDAVHTARGYRDEARALIAAGEDASATLESLSLTINTITRIAQPAGGN